MVSGAIFQFTANEFVKDLCDWKIRDFSVAQIFC